MYAANDFYFRYGNERFVLELVALLLDGRFDISRWRILTRALSVHAQSIRPGSYSHSSFGKVSGIFVVTYWLIFCVFVDYRIVFDLVWFHKVAVLGLGENPADSMWLHLCLNDLALPFFLANIVQDALKMILGNAK